MIHRLSGVALALYLPAHFYVLSLVLHGETTLDEFLHWTDSPLVKLGEVVLVLMVAAHLSGGLRLLLIEFTPWRDGYNVLIALGGGITMALGLMFALSVV